MRAAAPHRPTKSAHERRGDARCRTFTASSPYPSSRARCTWAMLATAKGRGSIWAHSCAARASPNASRSTPCTADDSDAGACRCSTASSACASGGIEGSMKLMICPIFMPSPRNWASRSVRARMDSRFTSASRPRSTVAARPTAERPVPNSRPSREVLTAFSCPSSNFASSSLIAMPRLNL